MAKGSLKSTFVLWAGQRVQEERSLEAGPLGLLGGSLPACGLSLATQVLAHTLPRLTGRKARGSWPLPEKDTIKDSEQGT